MAIIRSQLKKERGNFFLAHRNLNRGPLQPKDSVLPMSYTDSDHKNTIYLALVIIEALLVVSPSGLKSVSLRSCSIFRFIAWSRENLYLVLAKVTSLKSEYCSKTSSERIISLGSSLSGETLRYWERQLT